MGIFGFAKSSAPQDTTPRAVGQAYQNAQGQWEQEYEVWNGSQWVREMFVHNGVEWVKKPIVKLDLIKKINEKIGISYGEAAGYYIE